MSKNIPHVRPWKIRLGTGEVVIVDAPTRLLAKLSYRKQYGFEFFPIVSITPVQLPKRGDYA